MNRAIGAIVVALTTIACARDAAAAPRIELRPIAGQAAPDDLGRELRIYLADTADVVMGPSLPGTTLEARIAEANRTIADRRAQLVVWLEAMPASPAAGGVYVVVIVGKRDGRAVVDVGNVPASDAWARLLALRVGAFLDETLTSGAGETVLGAGPAPPPVRWWGIEIDAGRFGGVALGRLAGVLDLHATGDLRIQMFAGLAASLARHDETLEVDEQRLGAGARVMWRAGETFDLGAGIGIDGARIHARATSGSGDIAEVDRYGVVGSVGASATWWFTRQIAVRGEFGVERALRVERFVVEGQARAEIGRLTPGGGLGFLARF